MAPLMEVLEARVSAAIDLIADLKRMVRLLESELADARRLPRRGEHPQLEPGVLAVENARLCSERALIRERIRELIKEIDRAGS